MKEKKATSLKFIILLGIVSLFGDVTYEGARSISGPYLSILGASGATVGLIVGAGQLIGYGLRGFTGYLSDKTKRYWLLTIVGYIINLLAVPLLAFTNSWKSAAFLIILERFGKAIRVPARDAMLSYATKQTGRGWGFGIHEALDQIGAVIGPLMMTAILFFHKDYHLAFASLLIPALLSLFFLGMARYYFPVPENLEKQGPSLKTEGLHRKYWTYIIGISLVAIGFTDFGIISFHFQKTSLFPTTWIPFFYAIAMGVDAVAALVMGKLFDRIGMKVLAIVTFFSAFFAPFVFWGGFSGAVIGMILWGIGLGSHESIMRAVVPLLINVHRRGTAYGYLNLCFGIAWAIGSALMGFFYDFSLLPLVLFSIIAQLAAIPFFLSVRIRKA